MARIMSGSAVAAPITGRIWPFAGAFDGPPHPSLRFPAVPAPPHLPRFDA